MFQISRMIFWLLGFFSVDGFRGSWSIIGSHRMEIFLQVFLLGLRRICSWTWWINYIRIVRLRRRNRVNACSRFRRRINRFEIVKRRSGSSSSRRGRRACHLLMLPWISDMKSSSYFMASFSRRHNLGLWLWPIMRIGPLLVLLGFPWFSNIL